MLSRIRDLIKQYKEGLPACTFDEKEHDKLMGSMPNPLFGDAAPRLTSGTGKKALLHSSVLKYIPDFGKSEPQGTGDCSSHAARNAVDTTRIIEIVNGDNEDFYLRGATEGIYGSRGYNGQGMSIDATVRFVNQTGGILVRQKYGDIDLSKYNPNLAIKWGTSGVPASLLQVAKKNQVQQVANISTIQEAKDALFNGYAISVGSNIGFSQTRDKNGMSRRDGSWNHAMACIAYDDTKSVVNKCIFLIQNSWGLWNSGPKLYDQPDGSFWITEDDFYSMIAQRQAWVFSNVVGFPAQNVKWTIGDVF